MSLNLVKFLPIFYYSSCKLDTHNDIYNDSSASSSEEEKKRN